MSNTDIEERIEQLQEEAPSGLDDEDLPDGEMIDGRYDTEEGWDHLKYNEELLATKGPEAVANHALNEFDDFLHNVEVMERNLLRLYEAIEEGRELEDREKESIQKSVASIRSSDTLGVEDISPKYTTSIRAALLALSREGLNSEDE